MKVYRLIVASAIASLANLGIWACSNSDNPAAPSTSFHTFQNASVVIGQPNLYSKGLPATCSNVSLNHPQGLSIIQGGLVVADSYNNRGMFWGTIPTVNGAAAGIVVGPQNFDSCTKPQPFNIGDWSSADESALKESYESASDGTAFAIADTNNHRVLYWQNAPGCTPVCHITTGASLVLGQTDFNLVNFNNNTGSTTPSQNSLYSPNGVAFIGGYLYVADTSNNRILIWTVSKLQAADPLSVKTLDPDYVLGQANFTTGGNVLGSAQNTDSGGPSLKAPTHMVLVGGKLVVADSGNNRLLVYNAIPDCANNVTGDGQCAVAADYVLGQPADASGVSDFTSDGANNGGGAPNASGFEDPTFMATDGTQFAETDRNNNRVLIWNTLPNTTKDANYVLGQATFNEEVSSIGPANFDSPAGLAYNSGSQLLVSDANNNRVLVFNKY